MKIFAEIDYSSQSLIFRTQRAFGIPLKIPQNDQKWIQALSPKTDLCSQKSSCSLNELPNDSKQMNESAESTPNNEIKFGNSLLHRMGQITVS